MLIFSRFVEIYKNLRSTLTSRQKHELISEFIYIKLARSSPCSNKNKELEDKELIGMGWYLVVLISMLGLSSTSCMCPCSGKNGSQLRTTVRLSLFEIFRSIGLEMVYTGRIVLHLAVTLVGAMLGPFAVLARRRLAQRWLIKQPLEFVPRYAKASTVRALGAMELAAAGVSIQRQFDQRTAPKPIMLTGLTLCLRANNRSSKWSISSWTFTG